jgi:hypothetical protein
VIHALWRRPRQPAESCLDPAITRRSAAAATRPAGCAGDLAAAAERLLGEWHTPGTAAVKGELRILSRALLAYADQRAAKDRERGGGTWAGKATAADAYSLAAPDIDDLPPGRDPAWRLTALASGRWQLHRGLAGRGPSRALVALRQASHAMSEDILPRRRLGRSP